MFHTKSQRSVASVLSVFALVAACAGPSERSESVEQVDELLTCIERVQAETAVAKDSAHAAFDALRALVSPNYKGDAASGFAQFLNASEASNKQAEVLRDVCDPMCDAADDVFTRWTKDMEAFGNSRLRQRSQGRLDEARSRFQTIVGTAQAAQIALDAFHADLRDQALFLKHDLNSSAVASIRSDVRALAEQLGAVDARFDATLSAATAYVTSAALYGQVEVDSTTPTTDPAATAPESASTDSTTAAPTKKRTVKTLKPRTTSTTDTTEPVPAEGSRGNR